MTLSIVNEICVVEWGKEKNCKIGACKLTLKNIFTSHTLSAYPRIDYIEENFSHRYDEIVRVFT